MKRILNLLKYESWPSWLGPTIATVGIGGFFIGRNVLTQSSGKLVIRNLDPSDKRGSYCGYNPLVIRINYLS